eukprot:scaffold48356_cov63-Phaeocystis_antarctica.AAC.3
MPLILAPPIGESSTECGSVRAPTAIRYSTASALPIMAAIMSGVCCQCVDQHWSTSAPRATSTCISLTLPPIAAHANIDWSRSLVALTSPPSRSHSRIGRSSAFSAAASTLGGSVPRRASTVLVSRPSRCGCTARSPPHCSALRM